MGEGAQDEDGQGGDTALDAAFDVLIAADCTYDTDAHAALAATIARLLRPAGRAFLIAPRRGASLDRFCAALGGHALLRWHIDPRFSPAIWLHHEERLAAAQAGSHDAADAAWAYDPDKHCPVLLTVTKAADNDGGGGGGAVHT
ncbi:hypothetical protein HK105_208744 [Polyrhizophydium stewartii]|uniref:Calmodulin-lysine N-methyltransferase n=1 Tax=Polyrhizophydium stewartii TaxID=2732419 RepID=A0ABR4MX37_9FUNG|nr:hypothetical protein HK105_004320 [Polyrhizophydium stewartii]